MKNNPILQIVKMLLGAVVSYKTITLLFEAKNEWSAFGWLLCFFASAIITMHGYLKFRGEGE